MRNSVEAMVNAPIGKPYAAVTVGTLHRFEGVCNVPLSVFAQIEGEEMPVLMHHFEAGVFRFDLSASKPFSFWFDCADLDTAVVSVVKRNSLEARTFTKADSLTEVMPQSAVNPQMLALMRQMQLLSTEVMHYKARDIVAARKKVVEPPVVEPVTPVVKEPEGGSDASA